jgi:hypothetical protein
VNLKTAKKKGKVSDLGPMVHNMMVIGVMMKCTE